MNGWYTGEIDRIEKSKGIQMHEEMLLPRIIIPVAFLGRLRSGPVCSAVLHGASIRTERLLSMG